jgi:arylsulfatase A-like enzyme
MNQPAAMIPRFAAATVFLFQLTALLAGSLFAGPILPENWDPVLAADQVMERLIRVTKPHVKGAHDAEFVCVGDKAYIVEHDNDVKPGHGAGEAQYCVLTVVDLPSLSVEATHLLAKSELSYKNVTLPRGQTFVPRIIQVDAGTLRCFFASKGGDREELTWYRDFDLASGRFADTIHRAKLKTRAGVFDMQPGVLHEDAKLDGFGKPRKSGGMYIFDSFKQFDGKTFVALNNFPGKQNALAILHDDFETFEVVGHYNEPQDQQLSESAVNRLPDGTWMAILRNDGGNRNYRFTTSEDGRHWTPAVELPLVSNGTNSKPTFDKFGGLYYLGWQEATRIEGSSRSVFNVDVSRDGVRWERKYRFETPESFQYPTFHEHEGVIWVSATQSDHGGSTDRIMFGRLEVLEAVSPGVARKVAQGPKNVLLIVADDLNCDLGCYGHPQVRTPHLDRLASRGVRFDKAYCQYPLCGPSRASFLTGLRPDTTGVYVNRHYEGRGIPHFRETRPNAITLPQAFRQAGAKATAIGKLFHYDVPADIGTKGKGHDAPSWDRKINPKGHDKDVEDIMFRVKGSILFSWHADDSGKPQTDELSADAAIEVLEQSGDDPFFLAVGFFRPHWPYVAPKQFFDLYPPETIDLDDGPGLFAKGVPPAAYASRAGLEKHLTESLRRDTLQAYYASISFVDAQVGRLLDALDRLDKTEDTVVVFTSDHGYHLGEQGLWRKKTLWESGLRVPLIISAPGVGTPGGVSPRTVELLDLPATLFELCGVDPVVTDGESLVPLLRVPDRIWPFAAFSQMQRGRITGTPVSGVKGEFMGYSVRTDHLRYVQWGDQAEHGEQLYDYRTDPAETTNLVNDPDYRREKARLRQLLARETQAHAAVTLSDLGYSEKAKTIAPGVDVLKPGARLFTDRNYTMSEAPESLAGLSFLRTTIDNFAARVEKGGVLYALTPPESIKGVASQEKHLRELGFERTDDPVFELFPGAINHVCVYRKTVKEGESFSFRKVVLLVAGKETELVPTKPEVPSNSHPLPVPYLENPPS